MLQLQNRQRDRRAKDGEIEMSLGMSRTMVGMERLAGCRIACSQSLAFAGAADGYVVRQRSPDGDDMAPSRGCQRRLPGLLLLPYLRGTQQRIDRHQVAGTSAAHLALAKASAVGDRRLADQAIWAESRRGGRPSQPDPRPGRPAVSVRPCVGHHVACLEAPRVGRVGAAAARHALCSPADDAVDSQGASLASLCHQAPTGGPVWSNGSFRS